MAHNYALEKVSFNNGQLAKTILIYSHTGIEKTYNRTIDVKVDFPRPTKSKRPNTLKEPEKYNGKPTVEAFITAFIWLE